MDIKTQKTHVLEILLGAHFSNTFFVSFGALIPQIEIFYVSDLLKKKTSFDVKFVNSSLSKRVEIKANPKNSIYLKTGLDFRFHNCSLLNISYRASFATNLRIINEVSLGYRIDF